MLEVRVYVRIPNMQCDTQFVPLVCFQLNVAILVSDGKKNPLQQEVTVLDLLQHGNRTLSINSCEAHTLALLCVLICPEN